MKKNFSIFTLCFLFLLLIFSSCQGSLETASTSTPTLYPTKEIIPTLKSTYLPTKTIQPTYKPEASRSRILSLLKDNGGCKLPCLWGIYPGKSPLIEVDRLFSLFGSYNTEEIQVGSDSFHIFYSNLFENRKIYSFRIYCENNRNIINSISFFANSYTADHEKELFTDAQFINRIKYYSISNILTAYGVPEKVLIGAWKEDPITKASYDPFSVVLDYSAQGFFVEYISPVFFSGETWEGCPQEASISLVTWDKENVPSLEKRLDGAGGLGINSLNYDYFKEVQNITDISLEEFYQIFKNPDNTECLKTPGSIWFDPTRK